MYGLPTSFAPLSHSKGSGARAARSLRAEASENKLPGNAQQLQTTVGGFILLMVQKSGAHQLIDVEFGSLSSFLQGFFLHPRWLFGISEPSTVFRWVDHFCHFRAAKNKWMG